MKTLESSWRVLTLNLAGRLVALRSSSLIIDQAHRDGSLTHFGQTKIHKNTFPALVIPQKVGRLDVPMDDTSIVRIVECSEQTPKIFPNMRRVDVLVIQLHVTGNMLL